MTNKQLQQVSDKFKKLQELKSRAENSGDDIIFDNFITNSKDRFYFPNSEVEDIALCFDVGQDGELHFYYIGYSKHFHNEDMEQEFARVCLGTFSPKLGYADLKF